MAFQRDFFRYQLPALVWAGVIFILSSIPQHEFPSINVFGIDKIAHVAVFGLLAVFTFSAIRHQQRFKNLALRAYSVSLILTAIYGATDELHQLRVPGRTCDIYDLAADVTGAGLCLLIIYLYSRTHPRREEATRE